jgi:hypothetical protein
MSVTRDIADLHRQAMDQAEEAQLLHRQGQSERALELFRAAFDLERQAALAAADGPEPDRSVLFRSAASLALDCGELRAAEQLLATGLAGEPPTEVAEEIRDLLEQVQFQRHLDVRGWALETNEIQMSIAGEAIGFGVASSDEFVGRVQDLERIILRTAERRLGREYREGGSPKKGLRDTFEVFISVPRAASFAVTLKLGRPKEQIGLSPIEGQPDVIDEVLDLLEVAEAGDDAELARRIPDPPYLRNFSALARKLAPDGENVSLVGLTSLHRGRARRVALVKPRRARTKLTTPTISVRDETSGPVQVRGTLHYADDTKGGPGTIKLEQPDGAVHEIAVPEGMMTDIVRPLWDYEVVVTGVKRGKLIELQEIERADD